MKISVICANKSYISFKNAKADEKAKQLQMRTDKVKSVIEEAIAQKKKMSLKELAEKSGYTKKEIDYVFNHNSAISTLWGQVNSSTRLGKEDRLKKLEELKNILKEAKENSQQLSLTDLAQKTGLGRSAVNHLVSENQELNALWYWVKTKSPTSYSKEEVIEQIAQIKHSLTRSLEQKKTITRDELAEITGVEKGVVQNRIDADEDLQALWKENLALEDKNRKLEIAKIKKVLQEAKANGLKITQVYISNKTSIPQSTVFKRIQQNTTLNNLFESVRAYEHNQRSQEETASDDAKIAAVLRKIIQDGGKMSRGELAQQVPDIEDNLVITRLYNNPELNNLWQQIKREDNIPATKDEIIKRMEKITQILTEFQNEGKKTTLGQLADMTGLNIWTVHKCIKGSTALDALWQTTCMQPAVLYTKEEIDVQNVMIERILNQRIKDKMKPTIYQMAQYLDLTRQTVEERIVANEKLLALYKRATCDISC